MFPDYFVEIQKLCRSFDSIKVALHTKGIKYSIFFQAKLREHCQTVRFFTSPKMLPCTSVYFTVLLGSSSSLHRSEMCTYPCLGALTHAGLPGSTDPRMPSYRTAAPYPGTGHLKLPVTNQPIVGSVCMYITQSAKFSAPGSAQVIHGNSGCDDIPASPVGIFMFVSFYCGLQLREVDYTGSYDSPHLTTRLPVICYLWVSYWGTTQSHSLQVPWGGGNRLSTIADELDLFLCFHLLFSFWYCFFLLVCFICSFMAQKTFYYT